MSNKRHQKVDQSMLKVSEIILISVMFISENSTLPNVRIVLKFRLTRKSCPSSVYYSNISNFASFKVKKSLLIKFHACF